MIIEGERGREIKRVEVELEEQNGNTYYVKYKNRHATLYLGNDLCRMNGSKYTTLLKNCYIISK